MPGRYLSDARRAAAALLPLAVISNAAAQTVDDATVVVSATRFAESLARLPVSLSVIDGGELRHSTTSTLPELLGQQAGINAQDVNGNGGASATVDVRGFGATAGQNTLILLNGRRLTDMDQANVNWSAIPPDRIDRIEIMRGSGAVQFGDGAGGGVINIVTRSPLSSGDGSMISARTGSYATRAASATLNRAAEGFGFGLNASHYESRGYRANNASRQSNAGLVVERDYGAGSLQLSLDANWLTMRLPGFRQVEPAVGRDDLATDRRGTPTPADDSARRGAQFAADWRHRMAIGELAVDFTHRTREQWIYSATRQFARGSDMTLDSLSPRLRMPNSIFGGKGSLTVGIDWQGWDYAAHDAVTMSLMSRPYSKVDARQENVGVYAQQAVDLTDRLGLLAGVRREQQRLSASNTVDLGATCPFGFCPTAAPADAARNTETAWELGLRYRLDRTSSVFAKAARAFRFGNIDEAYETDPAFNNQFQFLKPQTSVGVEGGVQWRLASAGAKATVFQNDVRNEIHLDAFTNGVGNTNLPPSRRRGLELEADWQPGRALRLAGSYTFTDAKFLDGVFPGTFGLLNNVIAGKNVPLVPRHKLNLSATWQLRPDTRLDASVAHYSRQYMDNDEANDFWTRIPAYTVANLKLEHVVGRMTLALAVNNMFDEKYYSYAVKSQFAATRFNAYPLPERNVYLSARYRFE